MTVVPHQVIRRPPRREVVGHLGLRLVELLAGLGREPVGEDGADGVVGLVLEAPREQPVSLEVTGDPSTPVPVTRARSGRAQSTKAPGKDRQPSSASSSLRSLPSGRCTTGLHTTPTVCSPDESGQSKTKTR